MSALKAVWPEVGCIIWLPWPPFKELVVKKLGSPRRDPKFQSPGGFAQARCPPLEDVLLRTHCSYSLMV